MTLPLWFWIALGVVTLLSLLWGWLVARDVDHETTSQLWIVGEEYSNLVFTKKLAWFHRVYFISVISLSVLSFVFVFVL